MKTDGYSSRRQKCKGNKARNSREGPGSRDWTVFTLSTMYEPTITTRKNTQHRNDETSTAFGLMTSNPVAIGGRANKRQAALTRLDCSTACGVRAKTSWVTRVLDLLGAIVDAWWYGCKCQRLASVVNLTYPLRIMLSCSVRDWRALPT